MGHRAPHAGEDQRDGIITTCQRNQHGLAPGPFASPSALPQQLPDFRQIKDADLAPAFETGIREQLRDVSAITHNSPAPSFENILIALERSGQVLTRVHGVFA
jgi:peptidyl-dipeptidase Dcp